VIQGYRVLLCFQFNPEARKSCIKITLERNNTASRSITQKKPPITALVSLPSGVVKIHRTAADLLWHETIQNI
jgi:hypothetical protein